MFLFRVRFCYLLMVIAMLSHSVSSAQSRDPLVFVSSFAAGDSGGIQAYRLDEATGSLTPVHRTTGVEHPFFIVLSKDGRFLYSIHAKTFGGAEAEQVAAYALNGRTGEMTLLNRQSTRGTASCYLEIDATGKTVLVANYSTGNVAAFPVQADGSLAEAASFFQHAGSSVDPARQKGPYAHCFVISPDNRFAFAADLGLDQVLGYRLEPATAKLTPNQPPFVKTPAGAGPRHLTFSPNGKHVYVINELKNSVSLFDYATESGTLTERQTISTLPADFAGTSHCADLKITPNGKFLYGTNRGHDSIAAYRIGDDGTLTLIGITPSLGKGPQNLLIAGNGTLLLCANLPGNNIAVFQMDGSTGELKAVGAPIQQSSPACIRLLP
ncbi:MAG: lactonase family protein [Planctomycetes bacterium]|nr:lactonase family protein [Planctomycetota bacterium]